MEQILIDPSLSIIIHWTAIVHPRTLDHTHANLIELNVIKGLAWRPFAWAISFADGAIAHSLKDTTLFTKD
jgi:hypothetical protein